jgi:hypothetical protein
MTPAGYTWQARLKPCRGLGGSPAARQTPGSQPLSARTSLKLPRCLECILDGTSVGPGEIRNDHHVLDIPGRDAERLWKLSPQMVAEVEIGANYQVRIVKLPGYQSAVVPPLKPSL